MTKIEEVIKQLQRMVAQAEKQNSRQAYFALLYLQMTQAVQQGLADGIFQNSHRMEMLDVIFAKRYITAFEDFNAGRPCSICWRIAFEAAASPNYVVLQHLLSGINAHINLDLAIAAAETAPGEAIFDLQQDFEKINLLIADLSSAFQQKLEKIWWPMKLVSLLAKGKEKAVLNFSIEKARQASWANAAALAMAGNELDVKHMQLMDNATSAIGLKIFNPGFIANTVLRLVKWMEPKSVSAVLQKLK